MSWHPTVHTSVPHQRFRSNLLPGLVPDWVEEGVMNCISDRAFDSRHMISRATVDFRRNPGFEPGASGPKVETLPLGHRVSRQVDQKKGFKSRNLRRNCTCHRESNCDIASRDQDLIALFSKEELI
ncbi:hypothetical protein AVEN_93212-1 [Araneus ventricosus]|uniref:Uncharacterized protein n=1 Tax=Araneus ventricosus TaxID=182803 RepID=A0A4Y2LFS0_ARAVE|nr:hypothetical protein AVEN_93212-1 [Araneus ventricosus]